MVKKILASYRKIVTLYIDDTSIRLLITHGRRIIKWASLSLEAGLVTDGVITEPAKLADKLKQFLSTQKIKTKNVIVGLSGLRYITRPITFPQVPKTMLAEAVMREAERVLPVPLEQLYISWQIMSPPGGKIIKVFLVAVPRRVVDALLQTLHKAELNPYIVDIKPLALARVIEDAAAVIIDVQPTEFDIVVMVDGIPQPIRTVPFPSETLLWKDNLPMIKEELDRTIKFYNSDNPEEPLDSDVPIYVSGELVYESELYQSLSDELGHPVLPLSSPLKCPEQFDPNRCMVNIGLALKELSLGKRVGPSVVNPNLLPTPYRPKPFPWTRVIALPGALILISLLVLMVMSAQSASANIASIRNQLDQTNQFLRQRQLQKQELQKEITNLNKGITEVEASNNTFAAALDSLDQQGNKISSDLEVITEDLPSTIDLTTINHTGNTLTVSGWGQSKSAVLSYASDLDVTGRFSITVIVSMQIQEDGGVNFTLLLEG